MSLRLLAGPFNITNANGGGSSSMQGPIGWLPLRGIIGVSGVFPGTICVMTLDGVLAAIAPPPNYSGYGWGYWPTLKQWSVQAFNTTVQAVYLMDNVLFTRTEAPHSPLTYLGGQSVYLSDRRVYGQFSGGSGRVRSRTYDDAHDVVEFTGFPEAWYLTGPGRKDTEVLLVNPFSPGHLAFYDTELRVLTSPTYFLGMGSDQLMYSPEFGVLISMHTTQMRVWSLETQPDHITSPVLIAGSLLAGHIATFRVQLLGDHNEFCVGETIDWYLISGPGRLLDLQTETDESGYATARVLFEIDADDSVVLEAHCTC